MVSGVKGFKLDNVSEFGDDPYDSDIQNMSEAPDGESQFGFTALVASANNVLGDDDSVDPYLSETSDLGGAGVSDLGAAGVSELGAAGIEGDPYNVGVAGGGRVARAGGPNQDLKGQAGGEEVIGAMGIKPPSDETKKAATAAALKRRRRVILVSVVTLVVVLAVCLGVIFGYNRDSGNDNNTSKLENSE